jgi:hypothetical protein
MTDAEVDQLMKEFAPETVLQEAQAVVYGPRQEAYGSPRVNQQRIADMWSVILGKKVTHQQVIQCMIAVKLCRLINSPDHRDSYRDIAGYAAVWDSAHGEEEA